jgi:hypothetical protein
MILRNKMKTAEEKKDDSNLSTPDTNLSLNSLKDNDSKMKLFTGLTYYGSPGVENPLAFEQRTRCSQLYNEYF